MNYINKDLCAACGGTCCKNYAGACSPSNFGDDRASVEKGVLHAISTGKYAIDWWEGDPTGEDRVSKAHFIRPAHKNALGSVYDPTWGGECVFLTDTGCSLEYEARPIACRELEPVSPKNCVAHVKKKDSAIEWLPYNEFLQSFQHLRVEEMSGVSAAEIEIDWLERNRDGYQYAERTVGIFVLYVTQGNPIGKWGWHISTTMADGWLATNKTLCDTEDDAKQACLDKMQKLAQGVMGILRSRPAFKENQNYRGTD